MKELLPPGGAKQASSTSSVLQGGKHPAPSRSTGVSWTAQQVPNTLKSDCLLAFRLFTEGKVQAVVYSNICIQLPGLQLTVFSFSLLVNAAAGFVLRRAHLLCVCVCVWYNMHPFCRGACVMLLCVDFKVIDVLLLWRSCRLGGKWSSPSVLYTQNYCPVHTHSLHDLQPSLLGKIHQWVLL